uniref:Orphan protein n=1 Tax=Ascaris lumbricoides TaxID=6252 RepID=A0A0M3ICT5_ASCLU
MLRSRFTVVPLVMIGAYVKPTAQQRMLNVLNKLIP